MKTEFEHPYWEQYSKLESLRNGPLTADKKKELRRLAAQAAFSAKDVFELNVLTTLPLCGFSSVERLFFRVLRERFAYSVLSPDVLEIIAASSPLVELAAGNGYIAWLLQQLGADIVPIEAYPVEEGRNWFFNTRFGLPSRRGSSWTQIEKGTAQNLVAFADRTLLLCWPPKNAMASDSLRFYSGSRVILISEKSICANADFFRRLRREWEVEYSIMTGSWASCHSESLEIYSRR